MVPTSSLEGPFKESRFLLDFERTNDSGVLRLCLSFDVLFSLYTKHLYQYELSQ